MTDEARTKHELVCVGVRQLAKSTRMVPVFRELIDDGALDEQELVWDSLKASPGNVYSIESSTWERGGSHVIYIPKGGRIPWIRQWHDRDQRRQWEAEADAVRVARERDKMRQNAEKQSELIELTRPLADLYRSLPWGARTALLVHVQELICRHPAPTRKEKD